MKNMKIYKLWNMKIYGKIMKIWETWKQTKYILFDVSQFHFGMDLAKNQPKQSIKNHQKINQKIIQKSIKNRSKIHPKTLQNRGLEASWERLGALMPFPCFFFPFFGASWAMLGRKRCQHRSKLASKNEPKSIKNRCQNRSKKWCPPRSNFDAIWMDFGYQNRAKLAPK